MIDGLKPYPAYKDSGVPWLGQVPVHWDVRRVRGCSLLSPSVGDARERLSGSTPVTFLPMKSVRTDGTYSGTEVLPAQYLRSGFTRFERGDVLLAKITPCFENGKGACLDRLPAAWGFGSTEFHVLRPKGNVSPQFLYRLTTLPDFRHLGARAMIGAAGQQRVPEDFVANYRVAIPPTLEQAAIVRFLDHADRRIRRYIWAKQRLIGLLEEQKQAIVNQAVTRGLDPNVRLKPSGVEWLGNLPSHWAPRKLGSLFLRHGSGTTPPDDALYGGGIPWLMTGDLNDGRVSHTRRTVTDQALVRCSALKLYPPGSFVVAMYGATIGKTGILTLSACTNQACCVFAEPLPGTNVDFVQSAVVLARPRLIQQSFGGGQPNVNAAIVRALRVPVPPLEEQDHIMCAARDQAAPLEESGRNTRREIALLHEYRIRLIADVVTGKLDVREAAAGLPDEPEGMGTLGETDTIVEFEDNPAVEPDDLLEEAAA